MDQVESLPGKTGPSGSGSGSQMSPGRERQVRGRMLEKVYMYIQVYREHALTTADHSLYIMQWEKPSVFKFHSFLTLNFIRINICISI